MTTLATNEGIESILDRNIDLAADTIKAMLVGTGYTENKDHQFIDEGGANDAIDHRIAGTTDQTIGSKVTGKDNTGDFGYFDGADPVFTAVPGGATVAKVVIYKDTGVTTTSKILGTLDVTDTATNGGDITIQFATPANGGILKYAAA
jgi:hypothetical protein